jgi:hypothetical protein
MKPWGAQSLRFTPIWSHPEEFGAKPGEARLVRSSITPHLDAFTPYPSAGERPILLLVRYILETGKPRL